jgi:hypothetical protein
MLYSIKSYPKPNLLLCDYTQSFDNVYVGTYIYIYIARIHSMFICTKIGLK